MDKIKYTVLYVEPEGLDRLFITLDYAAAKNTRLYSKEDDFDIRLISEPVEKDNGFRYEVEVFKMGSYQIAPGCTLIEFLPVKTPTENRNKEFNAVHQVLKEKDNIFKAIKKAYNSCLIMSILITLLLVILLFISLLVFSKITQM